MADMKPLPVVIKHMPLWSRKKIRGSARVGDIGNIGKWETKKGPTPHHAKVGPEELTMTLVG